MKDIVRNTTVEDTFCAILTHCLDDFCASQTQGLAHLEVEGVHQMRVSLRRFRACLRVFAALVPKAASHQLVQEIKWLGIRLGAARDLDVFVNESIQSLQHAMPDNAPVRTLAARFVLVQREAHEALLTDLQSARLRRLVSDLRQWLGEHTWQHACSTQQKHHLNQPVLGYAPTLIDQRWLALQHKGRRFAQLSAIKRHELRIAVKKMRYAYQFFAQWLPHTTAQSRIKCLTKLQNRLGLLNDAAVAQRLLQQAGYTEQDPIWHIFAGWYASLNRHNQQRATTIWAQLGSL